MATFTVFHSHGARCTRRSTAEPGSVVHELELEEGFSPLVTCRYKEKEVAHGAKDPPPRSREAINREVVSSLCCTFAS